MTLSLLIQIGTGLVTAFSVFFATLLAKKRETERLTSTFSSVIKKCKDTEIQIASLLGGKSLHGDMGYMLEPNSPSSLFIKLAQADRQVKDSFKNVEMTEEEKLWLTILTLIIPWSGQMFGIIPAEEIPRTHHTDRYTKKVDKTEVVFQEIGHERSNTVATLLPPNYLITALPNGRYEAKDGDIQAQDEHIDTNKASYSSLEEVVEAICDVHNARVDDYQKSQSKSLIAAEILAADIKKWKKGTAGDKKNP